VTLSLQAHHLLFVFSLGKDLVGGNKLHKLFGSGKEAIVSDVVIA